MTQLKKIHNWILTDDPVVIARCQEIQCETDALSTARSVCYDWHDRVVRAFDETLSPTPGNTFSPVHISAFKAFQKRVKKQIGFDFDARHEANTLDRLAEVQEMFEHIYSDIQNEADWVLTFKAEFSDKIREDRKALEQAWAEARKEMFTALSEYPRNVSEVAFSNRFDQRFGHPSGRTRDFTKPTPAITDETLTADIRHFKAATRDIHADTEWMKAMPVPIPLITLIAQQEHITELVIKIEGGGRETRIAEIKDAETAAEWDTCQTPRETYQNRQSIHLQGIVIKRKESGVGDCARNTVRIRNLTNTGIILALNAYTSNRRMSLRSCDGRKKEKGDALLLFEEVPSILSR